MFLASGSDKEDETPERKHFILVQLLFTDCHECSYLCQLFSTFLTHFFVLSRRDNVAPEDLDDHSSDEFQASDEEPPELAAPCDVDAQYILENEVGVGAS